jgi:uncharacterized protein (TIGR02996 family)
MNLDNLNKTIRYVTDKKQDFYPAVSDPHEMTPHLMLADWLRENGDAREQELGDKIHDEVIRSQSGVPLKPVRLGDAYSNHDYVLNAVRTGHQNPTVRALASQSTIGMPPHPDLLDVLFNSDPHLRPHDHDVAVYLSPDDPYSSHTAHSTVTRINRTHTNESGLEAKVVRGQLYLLDHEHPDAHSYGAPAVVFHAPVNDAGEVKALEQHANQVANERFEGARMGPVTFGS